MYRTWRTGLAFMLLAGVGVAQANDATLIYKDRAAKKSVTVVGVIEEENFLGVKIRNTKTKETTVVPAADIERVQYKTKDVDTISYLEPFRKEEKARIASPKNRGGLLDEAATGYAKLEKEIKNPSQAQRYLQYKLAEIALLQAKFDPTRTDTAIKTLVDFKTAHREGWQLILVLENLAALQESGGKLDDARKTYEELADLPGAPDAIKQRSGLLVGKLHLRSKQYKEAEGKLSKLVTAMSGADLQKPLVQAYLIESQLGQDKLAAAQKELEALIAANADPRLRSVAYALLGDYYLKKGQPADAFWSYLRVDAQYNDDPDAQAGALYQLSVLFDKEKKNPIRGKECLNRLLDKRFEGSTYQKLAEESIGKDREKEKE